MLIRCLICGKEAEAGTGLNIYRRGERVFAATLHSRCLDTVLPAERLRAGKGNEREHRYEPVCSTPNED